MKRITFTDGVYVLAAIGGAAVVVTGVGVVALVAGRFIEEVARARAVKALAGAR